MSLAEIRKRLEAATRLPWESHDTIQHPGLPMVWDDSGDSVVNRMPDGSPYFEREDAAFIAHAPEDIRLLLDVAEAAVMARNCLRRIPDTDDAEEMVIAELARTLSALEQAPLPPASVSVSCSVSDRDYGGKMNEKKVLSGFAIVVLDRGFVYVGHTEISDDWCVITGAKGIRYWGTTQGLGELALGGPTGKTILDSIGTVRAPLRAVISVIDTEAAKWTCK